MLQIILEKLLKNRKVRVTPFRLEVLEVFGKYPNAISLGQIEGDLGEFDRITLYRTLKTFQEAGLIHEIVMTGDVRKYALCEDGCGAEDVHHHHEHVHFHCKVCDEVYCLEVSQLPQYQFLGFSIDSVEVSIGGVCQKCA